MIKEHVLAFVHQKMAEGHKLADSCRAAQHKFPKVNQNTLKSQVRRRHTAATKQMPDMQNGAKTYDSSLSKETSSSSSSSPPPSIPEGLLPSRPNGRKLSTAQECALASMVSVRSAQGYPFTFVELVAYGSHAFSQTLSDSWARRYVASRPDLTGCVGKHTTSGRKKKLTYEQVVAWVDALSRYKDFATAAAFRILNLDECRLNVQESRRILNIFLASLTNKQKITDRHNAECCAVPIVSADGHVLCVFYVLKATARCTFPLNELIELVDNDAATKTTRGSKPWPRFYLFNDTGNVNTMTYRAMSVKIGVLWEEQHPGVEAFLFMDNLGPHRDLKASETLWSRKVNPLYFVKCTTHFLQALDDVPFAIFKSTIRSGKRTKIAEKIAMNENVKLTKLDFIELAFAAERVAFSPKAIIAGFRNTGIYPFNAARIIAAASENVGAILPPPKEPKLALYQPPQHYVNTMTASLLSTIPVANPKKKPAEYKVPTDEVQSIEDLRALVKETTAKKEETEKKKEERAAASLARKEKKDAETSQRRSAAAVKAAENAAKATEKVKETAKVQKEKKRKREEAFSKLVEGRGFFLANGEERDDDDDFWFQHCRRCAKAWWSKSVRWVECERNCGGFSLCNECMDHPAYIGVLKSHERRCGKAQRSRKKKK